MPSLPATSIRLVVPGVVNVNPAISSPGTEMTEFPSMEVPSAFVSTVSYVIPVNSSALTVQTR